MKQALKQQRGVTFGGFIMIAFLLIVVAIFSMKIIPAYLENGKIKSAFEAMVHDATLRSASVGEIKGSYIKRAMTMDDVKSVTQDDIEISRDNGRLTLSATYTKKIPLAGNVSLLIEFNPSASN